MEINKIYYENCLETMRRMPDSFIDLVVTSPPYDNLRKYNGFKFNFEATANGLFRVLKKGGVVVWVVGDQTIKGSETGTSFKQALYFKEVGFNLHDTMIYRKLNFIPLTHSRYEQEFEFMFVFSKGKPKTFNPITVKTKDPGKIYNLEHKGYCKTIAEGAQRRRNEVITTKSYKIKGNIFEYTLGDSRTGHPAPFPEKLAEDHILSWSNTWDLVYDPFTGSGTTAKMSLINGRNYIGSELSEEYKPIIEKRISDAIAKLTAEFF